MSQWLSWRSYLSIIRLKGNTFVNNNLNNQNLHNIQKRLTSKICPLFQLTECSPKSFTVSCPVEHKSVIKILCFQKAYIIFIQFHFSLQYGAEFRRFSLDRCEPGRYKDFHRLIVRLHHLWQMDVRIGYADVQGELLPINNDDNFCKAVTSTQSLLRIFIQLQGIREGKEAIYKYSISNFLLNTLCSTYVDVLFLFK